MEKLSTRNDSCKGDSRGDGTELENVLAKPCFTAVPDTIVAGWLWAWPKVPFSELAASA
jgi:hypothetical protein